LLCVSLKELLGLHEVTYRDWQASRHGTEIFMKLAQAMHICKVRKRQ